MQRFAVIGLGRYGTRLARELARQGAEVIAVDVNPELVEGIQDDVTLAVRMDGGDEKSLKSHGIDKVDAAIVGIGESFEASLLATAALKRIGVKTVIARAATGEQARILALIGADQIVRPLDDNAVRLAQRLATPSLIDHIELADGHSVIQLKAPKKFQYHDIRELDLRGKYEVNIIAIKKKVKTTDDEGNESEIEQIIDVPKPIDVIQPDDILVIIGSDENLSKLPVD